MAMNGDRDEEQQQQYHMQWQPPSATSATHSRRSSERFSAASRDGQASSSSPPPFIEMPPTASSSTAANGSSSKEKHSPEIERRPSSFLMGRDKSSEGFGSARSYPPAGHSISVPGSGTTPVYDNDARTTNGRRSPSPSPTTTAAPSRPQYQPPRSHRIMPSLSSGVPPALSKIRTSRSGGSSSSGARNPLWDSAGAWMVYYFLANLSLTLYNKLLMNKFPFPWSLTAIHTLCGAIGSQACLSRGLFAQQRLTKRENLVLVAFSSLYTINIAVSNLSLNLVTVPFHQVVRAMTPLFAIALGYLMLRKRTSRKSLLALIPVILGVVFATYGDYYFTYWGLILTLIGAVLAALKTIMTNMILVGRLKLHPLDLLLRMSPLAFMQCIAASWYTGELERVREYGATQLTQSRLTGLIMNGAIAFALNVVSFTANKKTSPLSMTVAANVKQVLTIILAVIIFDLHITPTNLFGISLTLFGGAAYAKVEYDAKVAREQANAATSPLMSVVAEKRGTQAG